MDTGLSSLSNGDERTSYSSYLNPFGGSNSDSDNPTELEQRLLRSQDNSCQMGAEIFLRRILNKLFKQINELQPDELDDEFVYQSTITYRDYLGMAKHMSDEQMSCASLISMENILSKVMSSAIVRRPMHTSILGNLFASPYLPITGGGISISLTSLHVHLLMVLMIVGFIGWFFNTKLGVRLWRSVCLSIVLVGFVEFCIHKNELNMKHRRNLERCRYPTLMARIASLVSYDYDNCHTDLNGASSSSSIPNIAFTGVEYLSELVFQPLVHLGEKLGRALQSYLNSFTGFNYLMAPFFPVIAITVLCCIIPLAYALRSRQSRPYNHRQQNQNNKSIRSPRKNSRNNAITNGHRQHR